MELLQGFVSIMNPVTLALIVGGVFGGLVIGALPGLSAFTALAIMLPFTFGMEPVNGISFLMAVYVGGCSGGLISAILLGIPGTPSSIATCFDGYPMAQKGEAKKALGTAVLFSFIGGIFGALVLSFVGPYIARVALKFSSYDYFAIILFALTTVSALSEGSMTKGLLSCSWFCRNRQFKLLLSLYIRYQQAGKRFQPSAGSDWFVCGISDHDDCKE